MNALVASEIGLLMAHFRKAQVVVAEVCGEMGLVVAGEERGGSSHVAPLGGTEPHYFSFSGIGWYWGRWMARNRGLLVKNGLSLQTERQRIF